MSVISKLLSSNFSAFATKLCENKSKWQKAGRVGIWNGIFTESRIHLYLWDCWKAEHVRVFRFMPICKSECLSLFVHFSFFFLIILGAAGQENGVEWNAIFVSASSIKDQSKISSGNIEKLGLRARSIFARAKEAEAEEAD